jgi:hypothetical protein
MPRRRTTVPYAEQPTTKTVKEALRLNDKIYATTRAVLRALLIGREIYGVDYDGFYETLEELFVRPETAPHFAQFMTLYQRRRTSKKGKWISANIKYVARDVIYVKSSIVGIPLRYWPKGNYDTSMVSSNGPIYTGTSYVMRPLHYPLSWVDMSS